ncbi:MAG TPA: homoserine dehydrogenase, partial [Catenuloplanes sp.]
MTVVKPVRLALLGCGTVGAEVVRLLHDQATDLTARVGAPIELVGVAVRRLGRDRGDLPVDPALFTTDALGLVKRDDVDVVVEVVGGIEPARTWLVEALRAGKSVVTANKALLAEDGAALHDAALDGGADLYYEASVAGAIPLLRPLRESLHGDRITRVTGIVNGTTNFILSSMDATGASFTDALDEATELGYAEADPTADVEGFDAAAKAAILASLAFHTPVSAADVYREGISAVTSTDVARAAEIGCT